MRIKAGTSNSEGYIISLIQSRQRLVRAVYYFKETGFKAGDTTPLTIVDEYLVRDENLFMAISRLAPDLSDHEKYFNYLSAKYPTYTYH